MKNYTITKSIVECYKIRKSESFYWADITVDHNGNTGRIQIASDFGDYQYYWGACGSSFKEFLCKIGIDYVASKFGADRWFDFDQTIKSYKNQVLHDRRSGYCNCDEARGIFDAIKTIETNSSNNIDSFVYEVQNNDVFMKFCDYQPDITYTISPQFKNFWNELWPIFIKELKNEIL